VTNDLNQTLTRSAELTAAARHDEHLALMREALERYPEDLEVVIRAAEAHMLEAPERAAQLARDAVSMAPDDAVTLTRATAVTVQAGAVEDAGGFVARAARIVDADFVAGRSSARRATSCSRPPHDCNGIRR